MMIEKPREALILAGGLGTRLRAAVADRPKPMAPVVGRPFLEFLLDYWLAQGVERFVLSVGWQAGLISGHFGKIYRGAAVDYVREEEPLGTGGALALALRTAEWRGKRILALNGDTWLAASLDRLTKNAAGRPVNLLLVPIPCNDRYGGVELGPEGQVTEFGRPAGQLAGGGLALINAGCYLLEPARLRLLLAEFPPKFSLEADFLPKLAARGLVGGLVEEAAEFIDIGVPEDYRRFVAARDCKKNADGIF